MRKTVVAFVLVLLLSLVANAAPRWSAEQANSWYREQPWIVGCNVSQRQRCLKSAGEELGEVLR